MSARPSFIVNIRDGLRPIDHGGFADMGGFDHPIGGRHGLTHIGIKYEVAPPGSRTSFPHAEKLEEEFVFVYGGKPDVWIDGALHPLEAGDAVAFPAGTGIAHSFLNNSHEDMHLIIVGEHEVPGNQLYYPLNPERMTQFRAWNGAWLEAPKRPLGPHDGKARAGSRDDGAAPPRRPGFIAHYSKGLTPFANPKHTNHGGQSSRMGAAQGMTRIGINYDIVAPGKRTSRPHAESAEDEFVLVLKGRPDAWIDGHLHQLGEGDAAVFPAGTGIAHSFLNNSDEDVHLLVIGEHARAGNRLNYPLNPERMAEFEKLGRAWLDAPKHELGPHDGMARAGTRRG
ncbi:MULTISPECIES: cupin domain-containing protein [unclassified Devosia]|jgi:uncharacterized cupin superfamily protein|uniref:cupin domain-containing protein n=1 Tax=unclassified Devosia TaxID=196773 RepID=UPI000A4A4E71|nr:MULTISPECIES: cupin domain-containing protein [unclassified Devosia]